MKNFKFFIPAFLLIVFSSCSDNILDENLLKDVNVNESTEINELSEVSETIQSRKIKIKFNFRYQCTKQLGICIRISFKTSPLTDTEYQEGFGTANYSLEKDKLTLSFDRPIATKENPIVDVYGDWDLGSEFAKELGVSSIQINKGLYKVDYSENEYGKAVFDVVIK